MRTARIERSPFETRATSMNDPDQRLSAGPSLPDAEPLTPLPFQPSLAASLIRGTLWSVGLRWSLRLIGLLSTVIVARLLSPSDFGLLAMATLVMGLVETFLDADAANALLRTPDATKEFADSAWTIKVIQSAVVALAVAVAAPFAADYFNEPRVAPILWVLIASIILSGLASVGPLMARKELNFSLEVKASLIGRVATLIATIALAVAWHSYWALVAGTLIGQVIGFAAGYALHPYRPRFTLVHARELWGFSQWMLVSGIGLFFARKVDGFVVGRAGTAKDLGVYNIGMEMGQMITMELGAPLNRALLPVLSTLHGDPLRMRAALMKTVAAVNTVTLPAGVGLALVANLVVPVVLGRAWTEAIPFLVLFSLIGAIRFVIGPYYTLLMTIGSSRTLAFMSWFELAVFAVMAAVFWQRGVEGIAYARLVSTIVIVIVWIELGRRNGLAVTGLARAIARPAVGCVLMALALWLLPLPDLGDGAALAARIAIGSIVYLGWIIGSWVALGRPDGLESHFIEQIISLRTVILRLAKRRHHHPLG